MSVPKKRTSPQRPMPRVLTWRKTGSERTRRKKYKQNDCFPKKDSHGLSPSVFFGGKVPHHSLDSLTIRWMIVSQSDALLTDSELPICFIFFKVKNAVFSDENGVFCIFPPNAAFDFFAFSRPTQHSIICTSPPVSTFIFFASFKSYTRLRAILHNAGFYVRFSDQTLHT